MKSYPPYPFYILYGMTQEVDRIVERTVCVGPDSPHVFRNGNWRAGRDGWISHGIIVLPDELEGVQDALKAHKGDYTITEVKNPPKGQNIEERVKAIQNVCAKYNLVLPPDVLDGLTALFTEQFDPHRIGNWSINLDKGEKNHD